jgi:hypothetical protein
MAIVAKSVVNPIASAMMMVRRSAINSSRSVGVRLEVRRVAGRGARDAGSGSPPGRKCVFARVLPDFAEPLTSARELAAG